MIVETLCFQEIMLKIISALNVLELFDAGKFAMGSALDAIMNEHVRRR